MEIITVWEEQGIEKGLQQGVALGEAVGVLKGQREILLRLLRRKFKDIPPAVAAKLGGMNESELEEISEQILTANSLEEMGLVEPQSN